MNPYQVEWIPEALQSLADAWLQATDRNAVNAAQDRIDDRLAHDLIGNGTYLHEGLYQIVEPPLTAFYTVDQAQRIVEVSEVWYTAP